MDKLETGCDIVRYIERNDRLRAMAMSGELTDSIVFEDMRRNIPERELMPVLRRWALVAIGGAWRYERDRVRRAIKRGEAAETIFFGMVEDEISWDEKLAEIDHENMRELCVSVQKSILDTWIMRNGLPIGKCTAGYVRQEAWREKQLASGHMKNADFYLAAAEGLPDAAKLNARASSYYEAVRTRVFGSSGESIREVA